MTDPFLAFERGPDSEEAEKILAVEFDWDSVFSTLDGEVDRDEVERARRDGAATMLRQLLSACLINLSTTRRSRRAAAIGIRLVAVAHRLKNGHLDSRSMAGIARELGVTRNAISCAGIVVKSKIARKGP